MPQGHLRRHPAAPHTFLQVVALARPGMMFEVDVVAAVPAGK